MALTLQVIFTRVEPTRSKVFSIGIQIAASGVASCKILI